jgi:MYXO-CTERM domain-containing protein
MSSTPLLAALALLLALQQTIQSGTVQIHHWPDQQALARRIADRVARARPLPLLPHDILDHDLIHVYLAPDPERWDSLTGGVVPEWGAGVADPIRGVIVLPTFDWVRTPPHTIYQTLRHELAHVALQRYLGTVRIPRWFNEGYAQWAAGQWDLESAWRLRLALASQRAPPLDSITLDWPAAAVDARIAYLLSASAVHYLVERSGDRGLQILLQRWREDGDFESAFRRTFGQSVGMFEEEWRRHVRRRFGWPVVLAHSLMFWFLAAFVLLALFAIRRRRDRERLERLRAHELPDDPAYWTETDAGAQPEDPDPTGRPGGPGSPGSRGSPGSPGSPGP